MSLVLTLPVCAHLIENANSHLIVKDQLDLFHEFLLNRDVIANELVNGCSRRRSLGQFTLVNTKVSVVLTGRPPVSKSDNLVNTT